MGRKPEQEPKGKPPSEQELLQQTSPYWWSVSASKMPPSPDRMKYRIENGVLKPA